MANAQGIEVRSPLGKLVQGSVWELQDQYEDDGKTVKKDPQTGQVIKRAYFAIAVEKNNPEWPAFWNTLVQVAQSGYPQYFQNGNMPDLKSFAWKITDGDGIDKYGKPNAEKPGFKGCWIIKYSSSYLPRNFEKGKYAKHEQLQNPASIKPGFFIRVGAIVRANLGSKTPGLYLNSDLVELNFVGEEIVFGRDAAAAFAGQQDSGYVPAGAQQLGVQMGQAAMPGAGAGGAPNGAGMPGSTGMPGTTVNPNGGFVAGAMGAAGMPGAGAGGAQMPGAGAGAGGFPFNAAGQQPAARRLVPTPKAGQYTLEQFYANGFNEQSVVEQGFFTYA